MEDEILEIITIQEKQEVNGGLEKFSEEGKSPLRMGVIDLSYKLLDSCNICK